MDYRLPNGTVIRNVPDDMKKHAIAGRAIREGLATNADFGYDEAGSAAGETKLDRFVEGMGRGAVETGRQIGNMFGFISDDELADAQAIDADLMATGMGQFGSVVGEIAATLPVSGGIGMAGKAAGTGLRAARSAGTLSRQGFSRAGRVLQSPVARGATEGAAIGAIFGGPEHRVGGAMGGAAFGAGGGWLGQKIGNSWRNFKLTSMTPEAIALQKQTGQFIPLSQSGQGITKMWYNGVLANLPGVSSKVRGQYTDAVNDLRQWASTKAHPDTEWANVSLAGDDSVVTMMSKLDDFWSTAYDDINNAVVDATRLKVPKEVRNMLEGASEGLYRIPKGTGQQGANLLNHRNALNNLRSQSGKGPLRAGINKKIDEAIDSVDDVLKREVDDEVFSRYEQLAEPYKHYQILGKAFDDASKEGGEFTAKQLLSRSAKGASRSTPVEDSYLAVARDAAKALPEFPSRPGIYQLLAATQAGAAVATVMSAGLASGGVALAGIIGVGRIMASQRFQKVITGQHNMRRLLDPKHHPWFVAQLKQAGLTGRQVAAIEAGIIAQGEQ